MSEYRNQLDALNAEIDFPVTKQRLIDLAVARGFDDDEVRLALESTPIEIFNSPSCVTEALWKLSFPGA